VSSVLRIGSIPFPQEIEERSRTKFKGKISLGNDGTHQGVGGCDEPLAENPEWPFYGRGGAGSSLCLMIGISNTDRGNEGRIRT